MTTNTKSELAWVDKAVMHATIHAERAIYFNQHCMQRRIYFQEAILRDRQLAVEAETVIDRLRKSALLTS